MKLREVPQSDLLVGVAHDIQKMMLLEKDHGRRDQASKVNKGLSNPVTESKHA